MWRGLKSIPRRVRPPYPWLGTLAVVAVTLATPVGSQAGRPAGSDGSVQGLRSADAERLAAGRGQLTRGLQPAAAHTTQSGQQSLADAIDTLTTTEQAVALTGQLARRARQRIPRASSALAAARAQKDIVKITAAYSGLKACLDVLERALELGSRLLAGDIELTDAVRDQLKAMVEELDAAVKKTESALADANDAQQGPEALASAAADTSADEPFLADPLPVIARPRAASRYLPP